MNIPTSSKKIMRPEKGPTQADALLKLTGEFILGAQDAERVGGKLFARVLKSNVVSFHKNTRNLPIQMDRFLAIEWPGLEIIEGKDFLPTLSEILKNEDIHVDYSFEQALEFFERIYNLALDISEVGLSQPIGLIEKSLGMYELIYAQRRFMACVIAKFDPFDSVIFDFSAVEPDKVDDLISAIQESENEQQVKPLFVDRFFAKYEKYKRYLAAGKFHDSSNLDVVCAFLGLNQRDGRPVVKLFRAKENVRDYFFEMVRRGEFSSFRAFRDVVLEVPKVGGEIPRKPSRKTTDKEDGINLRSYGIQLYKNADLGLITLLLESLEHRPDLSDDLKKEIKMTDMTNPKKIRETLLVIAEAMCSEKAD